MDTERTEKPRPLDEIIRALESSSGLPPEYGPRVAGYIRTLSAELDDTRAQLDLEYRVHADEKQLATDEFERQRARAEAAEAALAHKERENEQQWQTIENLRFELAQRDATIARVKKLCDEKERYLIERGAATSTAELTNTLTSADVRAALGGEPETAEPASAMEWTAYTLADTPDSSLPDFDLEPASDERLAMEADAMHEPSASAMLAGVHITRYRPQDCACRGKHEHRFGYTEDCAVRDCTCDGRPASDEPARCPHGDRSDAHCKHGLSYAAEMVCACGVDCPGPAASGTPRCNGFDPAYPGRCPMPRGHVGGCFYDEETDA